MNYVEYQNGNIEVLKNTASVTMQPGDVFVIETPGGGGYGKAAILNVENLDSV
jgi:5-oxoprolinase (ATP-hydrolysing)